MRISKSSIILAGGVILVGIWASILQEGLDIIATYRQFEVPLWGYIVVYLFLFGPLSAGIVMIARSAYRLIKYKEGMLFESMEQHIKRRDKEREKLCKSWEAKLKSNDGESNNAKN